MGTRIILGLICIAFVSAGDNNERILRKYIVEEAESYVGIVEATGNNDGPEVEAFLSSVGLGKGYAWCAAFVHFILKQCEVNNTVTAWSPTCCPTTKTVWKQGEKISREPVEADVFSLYYRKLGRIGHTGFIKKWDQEDNYVTTIEGNTNADGSREGNGVWIKKRNKRTIYSVANWLD